MSLQRTREVTQTLRAIRSGSRNAARTAAFAGARLLRDEERKAAPHETGRGAKTIYAKRERGRNAGESVATVRVNPAGFYLHILEVGAKAHAIMVRAAHRVLDPLTRKTLRKEKGRRALAIGLGLGRGHGLLVFRRAAQHPGITARHWFRRTYDLHKARVLERVKQSYAENLLKQAEKKGL